MKRVVLIVELPLAPRDAQRYGVETLAAKGIAVTVLDVGGLTQPGVPQNRDHYPSFSDVAIKVVTAKADLAAAADVLAAADFTIAQFGSFGCSPRNLAVYRALAKAGRPTLKLFVNAYPGWQNAPSRGARWKRRLESLRSLDLGQSLLARLPLGLLGVRPTDAAVFSGRKSVVRNQVVTGATRSIFAHSLDYEAYLEDRSRGVERTGTAVFIDENVGHQIDAQALGVVYDFTPEYYCARLRALFDKVEAELGLKVVIAGNPRADYSARRALYGERPIIQGATQRLIGEADLVLGHRSTALGMAIMFDKPVLQVAIRAHWRHWVNRGPFDGYAAALAKPIVFMDEGDSLDLSSAMYLDAPAYRRYMEDYVKVSDSPDRPLWDIVVDAMEKTPGR